MLKSLRRSGARAAALLAAGTLALGGMVVASAVPAAAASSPVSLGPMSQYGKPEIASSADGRTMVAKYLQSDHLWASVARDGDWTNATKLKISGISGGVSMFGSETAAISADGRTIVFAWSYHNGGSPTVHARVATFDGSAWALGDQLDLTTPAGRPDMVMDVSVSADGSKAVVLFHTTSVSGGDIYAQAIHGGALQTRVTIQEAMGGYRATPPVLTSSTDGMTVVAVWRHLAYRDSKLYSSRSLDGGLTWSTPLVGPPSHAGEASVSFPMELASSSNGTSVSMVYSPEENATDPATSRYVYIRSSADGAQTWTEPLRIDAALGTKDLAATMSSDGTRRVVAWQKDNTTVQVITSGDSGANWVAPVTLRSGGTAVGKIDLAASADGTTLSLYWTESRKLYSAKSSDGGATWTAPSLEQDPAAAIDTGAVSVATSDTGATVGAVWEAGNYVYVLADGFPYEVAVGNAQTNLTWSTAAALSTGAGASHSQVAASENGSKITAVWSESNSSYADTLYASRSLNGGGTWSDRTKISGELSGIKANLGVISAADGSTATAIFNIKGMLYASRFSESSGAWSDPVAVISYTEPAVAPLDMFEVNLAASANGQNLAASWLEEVSSGVFKVSAATSQDGGLTWSANSALMGVGQSNPSAPRLAASRVANNNDTVTVAWNAEADGRFQIFAASVKFGGNSPTWGTTEQLSAVPVGQNAFVPSVSWSPAAEKVVVAWNIKTTTGQGGIESRTGVPDPTVVDTTPIIVKWDSAPVTASELDASESRQVQVVAKNSTTFVLLWLDYTSPSTNSAIKTVTSNDAGKTWAHSYATLDALDGDNTGGLALQLASDGIFAVWFEEQLEDRNIAYLASISDPVASGAAWNRYSYSGGITLNDLYPQVEVADMSAMSMVWVNGDRTVEVTSVGASSDPIPTTLTITTDPVSPKVGEAVEVMVASNPTDATGTVTVTQGSSSKTCELTAGECSIVMPAVTTAGTVTYTVSYAGDGTHAASSTTKSVTVAAADTAPTTPANPTTPSTPVAPEPSRASGSDRYATSAEVSKLAFPDGNVPVAYITTGVTFADSLAASAAASASDGPVLLAQGNSLAPAVQEELTRLDPDKIVVLGGTGSVSAGLMSSLGAFTDGSVTRTAGADRYATSLEASSVFTQTGGTVILTTGSTFADSMSAGSLFGSYPGPVLLTREGQGLPVGIEAELKRLAPSRVFIVGGTGSVSAELEADVTAAGYSVTRLAGDDRYETSASVAEWVRSHAGYSAEAIVASGTVFADGVSAGVLAGVRNAPVMLTNGLCWDAESSAVLNRIAPTKLTVIGGAGSISSAAELVTVCK